MATMLDRFREFHGHGTKQIGRNFCIPASLCNAVRLFGITDCTQEKLRDVWYAEQKRAIEPNLDDQMEGANIAIFDTMERYFGEMKRIDNSHFSLPGDDNVLFLSNADFAVNFIERHIGQEHAVIVSTWNRFFNGDHFEIICESPAKAASGTITSPATRRAAARLRSTGCCNPRRRTTTQIIRALHYGGLKARWQLET